MNTTNDTLWSEKLTWAFGSGELKKKSDINMYTFNKYEF